MCVCLVLCLPLLSPERACLETVTVRSMAMAAQMEVINPDWPSEGSRPQGPSEADRALTVAFVPGPIF